jgi:hypothetical protein
VPIVAAATRQGSTLLEIVAWASLGIAAVCALAIVYDILAHGYHQPMAIMDAVWPITALYWGPVAAVAYFLRGRRESPQYMRRHGEEAGDCASDEGKGDSESLPRYARRAWWPISKGTSHCGAGCTLGDICGEWLVFVTGWTIPLFAAEDANSLMAMFAADFAFAWTLGVVFQYFSIAPMRDVGALEGIKLAIKADTLSILSFQLGLFGFMALYHLVLFQPPLATDTPSYWFLMQVGMVLGYFTSWPVNAWLVKKGWKEEM